MCTAHTLLVAAAWPHGTLTTFTGQAKDVDASPVMVPMPTAPANVNVKAECIWSLADSVAEARARSCEGRARFRSATVLAWATASVLVTLQCTGSEAYVLRRTARQRSHWMAFRGPL